MAKCVKKGLLVLYEPSIKVTHTNKASTFIDGENKYDKTIWRLKKLIESRKIYLKALHELGLD